MSKNDISRKELSSILAIRYTTLADWLHARTYPRIDAIEKLAQFFNVSKSKLIEDSNNNNSVPEKIVSVPVIGNIAGGEPILAEQNIEETIAETKNSLPLGELFYLRVKGDSMSPTIPNGALVLIQSQPEVENGEIAAVQVDNDTNATLKRINRKGDTVILSPDNPEYHPIILDNNNPGRIIGRAVRYTVDL